MALVPTTPIVVAHMVAAAPFAVLRAETILVKASLVGIHPLVVHSPLLAGCAGSQSALAMAVRECIEVVEVG